MVSVVIPVLDGGRDLERCLEGIAAQRLDESVEVVVIDSSSTDDSPGIARKRGARVEVIPRADFDHGRTRNRGVELARGETIVFTSQDAYPVDTRWLARLTAPLREEARIAGVYGRQLPHDDARPAERFFLDYLYGPVGRTQHATGTEALSMETTLFSNANSAIRRELLERFPFAEDLIMSEDQEWATRVLMAGYSLRYEPLAAVRHSHRYTLRTAFERFFDSGVSAERSYLAGGEPAIGVLRGRALRYAREELRWLLREGEARAIPYTLLYELVKYAGLVAGRHHRRLPRRLKRRLSALPLYWDRHP